MIDSSTYQLESWALERDLLIQSAISNFQVIIEELQIANCHLRKMVDSLFVELNNCQRENRELKQRVRHLVRAFVNHKHGYRLWRERRLSIELN